MVPATPRWDTPATSSRSTSFPLSPASRLRRCARCEDNGQQSTCAVIPVVYTVFQLSLFGVVGLSLGLYPAMQCRYCGFFSLVNLSRGTAVGVIALTTCTCPSVVDPMPLRSFGLDCVRGAAGGWANFSGGAGRKARWAGGLGLLHGERRSEAQHNTPDLLPDSSRPH